MAVTNTGIVERVITGVNESDLWLDAEATSVVSNTGAVERSITGVNDGGDLFLDNSTSTATNTGIVERGVTGVNESIAFRQDTRTNLITYSEDFSQWASINSAISSNYIISPDGALNADKITATSTGDSAFLRNTQVTQVAGTTYSLSCFVKKGTTNFVRLANRALGGALDSSGWFDIENGLIASLGSSLISSKIEGFNNGWYKCTITGLTGASIPNQLIDVAASTTDGATGAFNGDYIYLFGAQVEEQSFATSYIPTSGVAVTVDSNSTSVVNNTGIVERPIVGVNESDEMFPDNTISNIVNIAGLISSLIADLKARATTFENEDATEQILINLQKC